MRVARHFFGRSRWVCGNRLLPVLIDELVDCVFDNVISSFKLLRCALTSDVDHEFLEAIVRIFPTQVGVVDSRSHSFVQTTESVATRHGNLVRRLELGIIGDVQTGVTIFLVETEARSCVPSS
jgi:hypothetical protein